MPAVDDDIVAQMQVDIAAAIPALLTVDNRRSLVWRKGDAVPGVILSSQEISREVLGNEDNQAWLVMYTINIMYINYSNSIRDDPTVSMQVETLRNLYNGYPDLVVTGVKINDINYETPGNTANMVRKGVEHVPITYTVETIEAR